MLAIDYREIIAYLESKIVGQPEAIAQLGRSCKIAQAGLRDSNKSTAVLLFPGPTGTGKSEVARALASVIHGDPDMLWRVDCNLLTEAHTAASLAGSPPG